MGNFRWKSTMSGRRNIHPLLVDDAGNWTIRQDVRNVSFVQKGANGNVQRNDWLTISGIKIGIGKESGNAVEVFVMVLKSSIGNRGFCWDLLPPGSGSWEYAEAMSGKAYGYAGYKQFPARWGKGTEPVPIDYYASSKYSAELGDNIGFVSTHPLSHVARVVFWDGDGALLDRRLCQRFEVVSLPLPVNSLICC
jgi:hypothetical protein